MLIKVGCRAVRFFVSLKNKFYVEWVTRREFILEELEEICKEVAKACNGTY